MFDFLNAFGDLVLWFLQSVVWDDIVISLPFAFVIVSMVFLCFRKLVGLR